MAILTAAISILMSIAALKLHRSGQALPWGTTAISVLKPVRGVDDEFEENLESFCRQTHPRYELIIGAAESNDPALRIARRVRDRHPQKAIRVVSGQWPAGSNPKIRNLRHLLTHARYQTILVSDGDVRVRHDYLSVMAGAIEQPNVGLVSNLIVGGSERTIGAACENAQLNGFVAATTAAAALMARHPIVVGKSMLFQRDALTNAGGFAAAADVLAEDYLLGRAVMHAGYRVSVLGYPITAVNRDWSVLRMLQRHSRWAQIRRHVAPAVFAFELLGYPLLWTLCLALSLWITWATAGMVRLESKLVLLLPSVATVLQLFVGSRLRGEGLTLIQVLVQPLSMLLACLAWTRAWFENIVVWRQQRYRIGRGSHLVPMARTTYRPAESISEAA